MTYQVGDRVQMAASGGAVFVVREILEDDRILIEAEVDAPGRYPFSQRAKDLVPAQE